jgi:hypothetical protein
VRTTRSPPRRPSPDRPAPSRLLRRRRDRGRRVRGRRHRSGEHRDPRRPCRIVPARRPCLIARGALRCRRGGSGTAGGRTRAAAPSRRRSWRLGWASAAVAVAAVACARCRRRATTVVKRPTTPNAATTRPMAWSNAGPAAVSGWGGRPVRADTVPNANSAAPSNSMLRNSAIPGSRLSTCRSMPRAWTPVRLVPRGKRLFAQLEIWRARVLASANAAHNQASVRGAQVTTAWATPLWSAGRGHRGG